VPRQGDDEVALVQLEGEARRHVVREPGDQRGAEDLPHVDGVLALQGEQAVATVEDLALQLGRLPALARQLRRVAAAELLAVATGQRRREGDALRHRGHHHGRSAAAAPVGEDVVAEGPLEPRRQLSLVEYFDRAARAADQARRQLALRIGEVRRCGGDGHRPSISTSASVSGSST
jgi:hypothetical protein